MAISIYQASVPVYQHFLKALSELLALAAGHCADKKIDEAWMIQARLYPDMFPFWRQVTRTTDHARRSASILARLPRDEKPEVPATSFADLEDRITATQNFLAGVRPEQMDGAEEEIFEVRAGPDIRKVSGLNYLQFQAMPQFFFHATTAYDILRHNGVALGKRHYLAFHHHKS